MHFHWTNVRVRRRYLAIPLFLLALTPVLAVRFNVATQPSSQKAATAPSPYCESGDLLGDAHSPLRFRIISNCERASGFVILFCTLPSCSSYLMFASPAKSLAAGRRFWGLKN